MLLINGWQWYFEVYWRQKKKLDNYDKTLLLELLFKAPTIGVDVCHITDILKHKYIIANQCVQ